MNNLLCAIMARYNTANQLHTALGNNFFSFRVPTDCDFPYCVFYPMVETLDNFQFQAECQQQNIPVQFNIYSNTRSTEEIGTLCEYLTNLYDFCELDLGLAYQHLWMKRTWRLRQFLADVNLWQYSVEYYVGLLG